MNLLDGVTNVDELLTDFKQQSLHLSLLTNQKITSQTDALLASITEATYAISPYHKKDDLVITYPEDGSTKELGIGTTTFDFYGGTVMLPTGTPDDLSDSLQEHDHFHCHSITIDSEQPIIIRIDNSGAFTTNAGIPFSRSSISFQRISVETDRKTNIKLYASTTPKAVYIDPRKFYTNNPYISNTSVAIVGTKNIEDIRAGSSTINGVSRDDASQCINENATSGYIYNEGPGDLLIEFHNGIEYSNAETLSSSMTRDLAEMNISKIRIDTTAADTSYILGAQ